MTKRRRDIRNRKKRQRVGRVTVRWDGRPDRVGCWFLRWTDRSGTQRSKRADPVLLTALQAARELDRQLTNEKLGIQAADPHRVQIEKLLTDYLKWLLHRPSSMKHVRETESILRRAFAAVVPGGVTYVGQVRRRDVERYLDGLAEGDAADEADQGLAGRTLNKHLTALKALFAWAVKQERLPSSPLAGLDLRPQYEKRVRRYALKPEQIERLLRAARRRGGKHGKAEPWEHVAYVLGLGAGWRKGEVATFRRCDLDLHLTKLEGSYTIRAEHQKGHKDTRVPFRPEVVRILRAWLKAAGTKKVMATRKGSGLGATITLKRAADEPVVPGFPESPVPALKRTLAAAGIPYRNAAGEVCDFHALRHTFVTNVEASLPVKQMLARHADVKTTMGYEHTGFDEMKDALERLPGVSGKATKAKRKKGRR